MRMGEANVYFGLCHMAAHVALLTPGDDSHLEVERTLAVGPMLLFIQRTILNLTARVVLAPGTSVAPLAWNPEL